MIKGCLDIDRLIHTFVSFNQKKGISMNTISLQSEQNELIRRILDVKDLSLLKKVEDLLNAEEAKVSNVKEPVTSYMSRQEIEAHIEQACKEAKLIQEGKLQPINAEDLLHEL